MWTTLRPVLSIMGTAESKLQYGKAYSNFVARFIQYGFSDSNLRRGSRFPLLKASGKLFLQDVPLCCAKRLDSSAGCGVYF